MKAWFTAHGIKVIAILTTVQMLLTGMGDNPLVKLLGGHVGGVITLATAVLTALLTFFAPGKALTTPPAPTAPPAA